MYGQSEKYLSTDVGDLRGKTRTSQFEPQNGSQGTRPRPVLRMSCLTHCLKLGSESGFCERNTYFKASYGCVKKDTIKLTCESFKPNLHAEETAKAQCFILSKALHCLLLSKFLC